MLGSLVQMGHYGRNEEKALVVAFLKWYELKRPRDLFAELQNTGVGTDSLASRRVGTSL